MYNDISYRQRNLSSKTIEGLLLHITSCKAYVSINMIKMGLIFSVKLFILSYPSVLTFVLGARKNRLNETGLLSTQAYDKGIKF